MKINDIGRLQGINKYKNNNQRDMGIKQTKAKKDEISISNEAKAMLEQNKEVMNTEKMEQIKEQIRNGTYQVDSKKVAEKMLDFFDK